MSSSQIDCRCVRKFDYGDGVFVVGYGDGSFLYYGPDNNHSFVWFPGENRALEVDTFTVRKHEGVREGDRPPITRIGKKVPETAVTRVGNREQIRTRGGRKVAGVAPRRIPKLDVSEVENVSKQ